MAQPSIASMFAQERIQAEHDSLELWVESEASGAWEPQQNGRPALSRQVPPSLPLMAQRGPSPSLPVQPSPDSYRSTDVSDATGSNVDVLVETTSPQHTVFATSSVEQGASMPSLPIATRNDLVPATVAARTIAGEEVQAVPLWQSSAHPMHSTEPVSSRSDQRVSGSSPAVRTDETMPLANPLVPLQSMPGDRQGVPINASNRQRRRYTALANDRHTINALQEIQVEQDISRPPAVSGKQTNDVGDARSAHQFIAPSRADASDIQLSAALPGRLITAEGMHGLPVANNRQVIEAQLIEQPAPAPTIQVTIGRIEVRATPPPPAPSQSQQRSTPTIMSLDQYLQQRSKGGDR